MNWKLCKDDVDFQRILAESYQHPQLIFKDSPRCGISRMVKRQVESDWSGDQTSVQPHLLSVIECREVSNAVANYFQIRHESPQALLIQNGALIYHASHHEINIPDALSKL